MITKYIKSSLGKKQIVAITGLMLVGFLVFHLSANLLIFLGPDAYNWFPELMRSTGPGLRVLEFGLAALFLTHIGFTISLVRANRKARGQQYAVQKASGKRSLATRLMPYTGGILLLFLILHIQDYTLADHHGAMTVYKGQAMGVYGLVANSFAGSIANALFYIVAMFAVGFHLAHGIQSVFQTFGFNHPVYSPRIQSISTGIGLVFAVAFSSIPIYFICTMCIA